MANALIALAPKPEKSLKDLAREIEEHAKKSDEHVLTAAQLIDETHRRVTSDDTIGMGWERYIGMDGGFVGMVGFGASAPAPDLYRHFNITSEAVAEAVRARL